MGLDVLLKTEGIEQMTKSAEGSESISSLQPDKLFATLASHNRPRSSLGSLAATRRCVHPLLEQEQLRAQRGNQS